MNVKSVVAAILAVGGLILVSASTYTVGEYEQAVLTRFGEIEHVVTEPGLHFKAPFVTDVRRLDRRWLEWDGSPNQIPTRDKKYIWVDAYARWRISDPELFYKRLRDEGSAQSRLDDIIDGEIRNVIARHDLIEMVRTTSRPFQIDEVGMEDQENTSFAVKLGREKLVAEVLKKASSVMPEFGIELADVRIKRINYTEAVQQEVYGRMISERQRIAARFRSEGQERKSEIRGRIALELRQIESDAYRKAEELRGKGEAEAAGIYAATYEKNPGLYQFLKTLETYAKAIDAQTTVVLSTDAEVLKYMKSEGTP